MFLSLTASSGWLLTHKKSFHFESLFVPSILHHYIAFAEITLNHIMLWLGLQSLSKVPFDRLVQKSQTGLRPEETSGVFWWREPLSSHCIHCCTLSWEKVLQEKLHIMLCGSCLTTGKLFPLVLAAEIGLIMLTESCKHLDVSSLQTAKSFHCNWTVTHVHLFHCLCHPKLSVMQFTD